MPEAGDRTPLENALLKGELTLQGQFLQGSNYTFLGKVSVPEKEMAVVYKPTRGEQPLWDFPTGTLAKREVVAYWISQAIGWNLVPPTVYRRSGPLGPGSVQLYVEHDDQYHYFNFQEGDRQKLRPVILFDYMVNNADRKASHVLVDDTGAIWLIDHGLCFHEEDKLRTVIWDFVGEPIPAGLLGEMDAFLLKLDPDSALRRRLRGFLRPREISAMATRTRQLLENGCFPMPPAGRRIFPWPPV
jgi:uncharacterized repeat protein (TIGR03843 family)